MENRVSLITLGVADVARARAFYEALGWSGESPDGNVVFFQAGGMILALWGRGHAPEEVDAVLAEARAAGATTGRPGATTFWGGYSRIFVDPDGHPWEVAHNPGWELAAEGRVHLPRLRSGQDRLASMRRRGRRPNHSRPTWASDAGGSHIAARSRPPRLAT